MLNCNAVEILSPMKTIIGIPLLDLARIETDVYSDEDHRLLLLEKALYSESWVSTMSTPKKKLE